MKILKLEFENINSLFGKWIIDFTDNSFDRAQNLFAISGPTGSGKSSILDAVTLALYGRTPRQEKIYTSVGNELMTRDTGYCSAKVTYRTSKGEFVSEWSERRAHDSAGGKLQDAIGIVYKADNPNAPLFSGKTGAREELSQCNSKIIGLDYSQFCRSIMLAQGEFSKFLTCNDDERAAILEKLNGAEKYRRIACLAGEHWSDANQTKNKAQAEFEAVKKTTLSEIEKETLFTRKIELENEKRKLEDSLRHILELLHWRTNVQDCEKSFDDANTSLKKAQQVNADFNLERERLNKALRANNCKITYEKTNYLKEEIDQKKEKIEEANKELGSIANELSQTKQNVKEASDKLLQAEKTLEDSTSLWNEVRSLDVQLKNANSAFESANKKYTEQTKTLNKLKSDLENQTQKIKNLQTEISKTDSFLQEHETDASIANVLSGLNFQIENFKKKCVDIDKTSLLLNDLKDEKENLESSIQKLESKLLKCKDYLQLHEIDVNLEHVLPVVKNEIERLNAECDEIKRQKDNVESYTLALNEKSEFLIQCNENIFELEKEQLDFFKNDVIVLASAIQKHLQQGKPCPVCGSIEHHVHNTLPVNTADENSVKNVAEKIRLLNTKMEKLFKEKKELESKIDVLHSDLKNAKDAQNKAQNSFDTIESSLNTKLLPWNVKVCTETFENDLAFLESESLKYNKAKKFLEEQSEALNTLRLKLNGKNSSFESENNLLLKLKKENENLAQQIEKCVSAWISCFDTNSLDSIAKTLKDRSEKYTIEKERLNTLQGQYEVEKTNLKNVNESIFKETENLNTAKESLDEEKNKCDVLQKERFEKFGNENVDDVENAVRFKCKEAKKAYEESYAKEVSLLNSQSKWDATLKGYNSDVAKKSNDLKAVQKKLEQEILQNEFVSIEELKTSFLEDDTIFDLQTKANQIKEFLDKAKQSVTDSKDMLDNCLKKYPEAPSKEELEKEENEQKAHKESLENELSLIKGKLENDASNLQELKLKEDDYHKALQEFNKWDALRALFGKKNGEDFSKFVQGLTFQSLLNLANKELHSMKGRYTLVPKGDLGFEIQDTHFVGNRSITNLSGGEKFLVSLSLALGIADFASKHVKIETLFMDEGFGTLDSTTLEDVMECLKAQRMRGKMLGVITHVQSIVDEFRQVIRVEPTSCGHSVIHGAGVFKGA